MTVIIFIFFLLLRLWGGGGKSVVIPADYLLFMIFKPGSGHPAAWIVIQTAQITVSTKVEQNAAPVVGIL